MTPARTPRGERRFVVGPRFAPARDANGSAVAGPSLRKSGIRKSAAQ